MIFMNPHEKLPLRRFCADLYVTESSFAIKNLSLNQGQS